MSDIPVIDPTMTPAWDKLDQLADTFEPDLRKMFADDPERTKKFTFQAADLHVDLSKNLVCPTLLGHLLALAEQTGVADLRDRMFAGEHINVTEDRAVLHTALRRPATDSLTVDGQDAIADVHEVLEKEGLSLHKFTQGTFYGIVQTTMKATSACISVRIKFQIIFISWRFALLCGCILLALAFLLGRVAWLQVISPDMLVKEGDTTECHRIQAYSGRTANPSPRSG